MRLRISKIFISALAIALVGCGGSGDNVESTDSDAGSAPVEATAAPTSDPDSAATAAEADGSFELALANGQTYTGTAQCSLEPDGEPGGETLFSASGEEDSGLWFTVFQWDNTVVAELETVTLEEFSGNFDNVWRSATSTGLVLELNGDVISARGQFFEGDEWNGPYTDGEVTVSC